MVFSQILESVIQWSLAFVHAYGPFSVFLVVLLEEVMVPIPSPLVIMGAGYALLPAGISLQEAMIQVLYLIVIPASLASAIGAFFLYFVGYYGGKRVVEKFSRFLGFGWKEVVKAERRFEDKNSTWATIFLLRAIPFFPIAVVSLAAGVIRLNKWKFFVATFLGSLPRTFILGLFGWRLGPAYLIIAKQLNAMENILLLIALLAVAYLLYRFKSKYIGRAVQIKGAITKKIRR